MKDSEGWFGPKFPENVDELHFQVVGVIKDIETAETRSTSSLPCWTNCARSGQLTSRMRRWNCELIPMRSKSWSLKSYQTPGISLYRTRCAYSLYPANSSCRVWSSHIVRRTRSGTIGRLGSEPHRNPEPRACRGTTGTLMRIPDA